MISSVSCSCLCKFSLFPFCPCLIFIEFYGSYQLSIRARLTISSISCSCLCKFSLFPFCSCYLCLCLLFVWSIGCSCLCFLVFLESCYLVSWVLKLFKVIFFKNCSWYCSSTLFLYCSALFIVTIHPEKKNILTFFFLGNPRLNLGFLGNLCWLLWSWSLNRGWLFLFLEVYEILEISW